MSCRPLLLGALCALFAPLGACGAVVNGHFETGNLSGWTLTGLGAATGATLGAGVNIPPPEGSFQGRIDTTGNGTAGAPVVAAALGVDGPAIAGLGAGTPTVGSCITQNITVAAGDVLSFDWNFLTDELNESATFNDFAFFTITSTFPGSAYFLASRNASTYSLFTPGDAFDGQTGWDSESYTFGAAGAYKLGFGVLNVGDSGHNSILILDNIVVPEPGAMTLVLMIGAALTRRRTS